MSLQYSILKILFSAVISYLMSDCVAFKKRMYYTDQENPLIFSYFL